MKKEYAEILLEEMRDKFDLVLEAHTMLNKKVDDVAANLAETNRRLDKSTEILSGRIGKVEQKIDKLDQKIDHVAADLAAHRADTESHRGYQVAER
jgi:hypothetical protein